MKNILYLGSIIFIFFFLFNCKQFNNSNIQNHSSLSINDTLLNEKIRLGKKLFFDKRLSINNEISCASCHIPKLAFTDGKALSIGVNGNKTQRNASTILNVAFLPTIMYDAHLPTLEQQVIVPIQEHTEMGMNMKDLILKISKIDFYQNTSKKIFNRDFDAWVLTRSISAFERSLYSTNSSFDKFYYNNDNRALSKSQKRGWKLFSEKFHCHQCHPAPYFTNFKPINNGLYIDYGKDKGRFRIHNDSLDIGKFKVPSLRNVELTGPYMHDGSFTSIDEVINHYANGGKEHVNKDKRIVPFNISKTERIDLKNFLISLTDTSYIVDY